MSELKEAVKVTQTQYDTLNQSGFVSDHSSDPRNIYMVEQSEWSNWYSISSGGTTMPFIKDNYYQIQVKNTGSTIIQDHGIFRASSDRSCYTCKFMLGQNVHRLSFYRPAPNAYVAYAYVMTGSSWSSLNPATGFMIRYRRVNL